MSDIPEVRAVDDWLNGVSYADDPDYVPSAFALEFVNFNKLVNGGQGEENVTPVLHYKMLDQVAGDTERIANMIHRGAAKTTVMGEYLFLYLGVYGALPDFGVIELALYVSDSIENGVKNMRKNLEFRWENSDFLREYIPETRFTRRSTMPCTPHVQRSSGVVLRLTQGIRCTRQSSLVHGRSMCIRYVRSFPVRKKSSGALGPIDLTMPT